MHKALHNAIWYGKLAAMCLLLSVAPGAATAPVPGYALHIPVSSLAFALSRAKHFQRGHASALASRCLAAARLLLPATPLDDALAALMSSGSMALPLLADLVARRPLSPGQWQRIPAHCTGLAAALPAVMERSEDEAGYLVAHLTVDDRRRLRTAALCLLRAQRAAGIELPTDLVRRMLALGLSGG